MKKLDLKLIDDRIVVLPDAESERVSPGGIVVPGTARGTTLREGVVMAVGPGKRPTGLSDKRDIPLVGNGDRIIFESFGAMEFVEDGIKYQIMRESDIIAVREKR